MQRRFSFPVTIEMDRDDPPLMVRFIDLPGAVTFGRDLPGAMRQARDALETWIAGLMRDGASIPKPSKPHTGTQLVEIGPLITAKAALYKTMRDAGMTNVVLAERLGVAETEVRRMLSATHKTKIDRLDKALGVFGKHIVVQVTAE